MAQPEISVTVSSPQSDIVDEVPLLPPAPDGVDITVERWRTRSAAGMADITAFLMVIAANVPSEMIANWFSKWLGGVARTYSREEIHPATQITISVGGTTTRLTSTQLTSMEIIDELTQEIRFKLESIES